MKRLRLRLVAVVMLAASCNTRRGPELDAPLMRPALDARGSGSDGGIVILDAGRDAPVNDAGVPVDAPADAMQARQP